MEWPKFLRKGKEEANNEEAERINDEKLLRDLLGSYRSAKYKMENIPRAVLGDIRDIDTRELDVQRRLVEELPTQIISLAEKLGDDGQELIKQADEEVRRQLEEPLAT